MATTGKKAKTPSAPKKTPTHKVLKPKSSTQLKAKQSPKVVSSSPKVQSPKLQSPKMVSSSPKLQSPKIVSSSPKLQSPKIVSTSPKQKVQQIQVKKAPQQKPASTKFSLKTLTQLFKNPFGTKKSQIGSEQQPQSVKKQQQSVYTGRMLY